MNREGKQVVPKTLAVMLFLAVLVFVGAVSAHANSTKRLILQARTHEKKGDYAEAAYCYSAAIYGCGHNDRRLLANLFFDRGRAYHKANEYAKALQDYEYSLQQFPKMEAVANRALCLLELGRPQEAIQACTKALADAPNHPGNRMVHYVRARAYGQTNADASAYRDYSRIIKADPKFRDVLYRRGLVLQRLKKLPEAIKDFSAALRLSPSSDGAYFGRGVSHLRLRQYTEAAGDFAQVVRLRPKNSAGWHYLSLSQFALNEFEAAEQSLRTSIRIQPTQRASLFRFILLHRLGRSLDEIRATMQEPVKANRSAMSIYTPVVELFTGEITPERFRSAVQATPAEKETLPPEQAEFYLAIWMMLNGNNKEGKQRLKSCLRSNRLHLDEAVIAAVILVEPGSPD